ncbi:MAG TPA: right-handed parallel beta-helix repeat-containing protein [Burkholderiales bacterium]|nr:right-handed parallel beta-helix repeat-containing protein [Burkholderiales bacterium]
MKSLVQALLLAAACSFFSSEAAMRYVDPSNPAAQDAGAGDAAHPYRTLTHAMKQLKPGDVLTIAGGTYRESLIFPEINWWAVATTVIQPVPGANVLIKGSDVVTGWTAQGGGLFVRHNWTVNSQQVFVDGIALKQIGGTVFGGYPGTPGHYLAGELATQGGIWPGRVSGGVAQMTTNSFYYDAVADSLYIKVPYTSLTGHTVEVSVRPFLVFGRGVERVTLKKLNFMHANTTAQNQNGAITLIDSNRNVIDGLDVRYVDGAGMDISGDENTIKNNAAKYCGQLGMKVRGRANTLTYNTTNYNNTRGFNTFWEAGGAKFVGNGGLRDSIVARHYAVGNNGDGIWFDWMNDNNRIYDSTAAYNMGFGIHYEASQRGYIYDNYAYGNKLRGIYLPHSSDSIVAFNMVAKNGFEGIAIIDEGRSPTNPLLRPRDNLVHGNIIAWNGKAALVLPKVSANNTANYNLDLGVSPPTFSLGWTPLFTGLDAWTAASGQDAHSWFQVFDVPPALRDGFAKKSQTLDWSAVRSVASPHAVPSLSGILPQSVAHRTVPGPEWW